MKNKILFSKVIIIGLICLCIMNYGLTHYDGKEYDINNLQNYVDEMCKIGKIPGISIAIIDDEDSYYINKGYVGKDQKIKVTNNTKYELASTTKAFTALGILILEKEGKLNRSHSVNEYIPWFEPKYKGENEAITIEHLLCHTSGIPPWTISTLPIGTVKDNELLVETIKKIENVELDNLPGKTYSYATINYDILALIIEEITGVKYEDYIKKNVLNPLGMSNSYFRVDDSKSNEMAQGHRYSFMDSREYDAPTFYGNTAAGYLVSTTEDLMIWMKAQMGIFEMDNNKEIEKINNVIIESHSYPINSEQHYFAGWSLYDTYFCHSGNNPNFSSQVIIDRLDKKAVFSLANICGSSATKVTDDIYRMIHGEKIKIGFWLDENSLIDLVGIIICFAELYLGIIIFERKDNKGKNKRIKAIISLLIGIIIIGFPYIIHYNYLTLRIWFSPWLFFAIISSVICCVWYFICYMITVKNNKLKK